MTGAEPTLIWRASARRLGITRALVCGFATLYTAIRAWDLTAVASLPDSRFSPVDIVDLLLSRPMAGWLLGSCVIATLCTGLAATMGWRFRWTGPMFAVLLWWVLTYRHSWGQVLHTENLIVLHVAILACSPAGEAFKVGSSTHSDNDTVAAWRWGWALQLMALVTTLSYFIAAWAKLRNGGWDWMTGDVVRNQIAYDNLRKHLLGDFYSPVGGWLTKHGWLFPPMATLSMVVELFAPIAVFSRRFRSVWIATAWLFHVSVLVLMAILFPYQLLGVAFVPFLAMDDLYDKIRLRLSRIPTVETTT
jgi:hypothetical protein